MAVLGIQFVITMMMATVLSRVGPHLSLARWLLSSRLVVIDLLEPVLTLTRKNGVENFSQILLSL